MKSRAALLVRHRWIRLAAERPERFECDRRAFPLYESLDPACYGCGARILAPDVDGWPDRFRASRTPGGETIGTDALLERLGLELDLLHEKIKLDESRETA